MKKIERTNDGGGGVGGIGGPCGACKFLRRKCMTDCVFAPYFDSEHGTAYFASVHKVFGASNVSKLLLRLPPHHRLDAVVTLCYEAIARIRDPVYGCVAHICTLQQQVMALQSELANVRARLCIIRSLSLPSSRLASTSDMIPVVENDIANPNSQMLLDPLVGEASDLSDLIYSQQLEEAQVQAVTREFVSRCLPGFMFGPPDGSPKGFRQ